MYNVNLISDLDSKGIKDSWEGSFKLNWIFWKYLIFFKRNVVIEKSFMRCILKELRPNGSVKIYEILVNREKYAKMLIAKSMKLYGCSLFFFYIWNS